VSEDISYIESQNRGLQVQTSNQQALLDVVRQLVVGCKSHAAAAPLTCSKSSKYRKRICASSRRSRQDRSAACRCSSELRHRCTRPCRPVWINVGPTALFAWTKLIAANAEVSATIARMKEYQENSAQFSKRIMDYLDVQFKYQVSYLAPELGPQLMGSPIRRYLKRVRAGRSRPRWRRIAQCASIS